MPAKHRKLTHAEHRLFNEVLVDRYSQCLREINERGLEGCAQWAVDQAHALIEARRKFLSNSQRGVQ